MSQAIPRPHHAWSEAGIARAGVNQPASPFTPEAEIHAPARLDPPPDAPPTAWPVRTEDALTRHARMLSVEPRLSSIGVYESEWRMAYVRGPEGIIVSLAERVG